MNDIPASTEGTRRVQQNTLDRLTLLKKTKPNVYYANIKALAAYEDDNKQHTDLNNKLYADGIKDGSIAKALALAEQNKDAIAKIISDAATHEPSSSNLQQIRIVEQGTSDMVSFPLRPEFSENSAASYAPIDDVRYPSSILLYMGSTARTFNMTVKLLSRSSKEASDNYKKLNLLKSWVKPSKNFISRDRNGADLVASEGAPKALYLYAYGNICRTIPIVMASIGIEYPSDIDYVDFNVDNDATKHSQMPIIMTITMAFTEIHSIEELEDFDLNKYKTGSLPSW